MVERALSWLGVRYRFGGQDEKRGFDCAIRAAVYATMTDLPRTAAAQYRQDASSSEKSCSRRSRVLQEHSTNADLARRDLHRQRRVAHAASRRRGAAVIDRLASPYFDKHFAGARRP
jgi:cell wall-associated NlpC family hydrolase